MRRSIWWALALSAPAFGLGRGGDGPCPVPNAQVPFVVARSCYTTPDPITRVKLVDDSARLFFQNVKGEAKVIPLRPEASLLPLPKGILSFSDPLALFNAATLKPIPLPSGFKSNLLAGHSLEKIVTARPSTKGARAFFDVAMLRDGASHPEPLCSTPLKRGLMLSGGSDLEKLNFHSISWEKRRTWVRFYDLDVRSCDWVQTGSLVFNGPMESTAKVFRLEKNGMTVFATPTGVYRVRRAVVDYFPIASQKMVLLDAENGLFLYQTSQNDLGLFLANSGRSGIFHYGAVHFKEEMAVYSASENKLFLAGSAEDAERVGVYSYLLDVRE